MCRLIRSYTVHITSEGPFNMMRPIWVHACFWFLHWMFRWESLGDRGKPFPWDDGWSTVQLAAWETDLGGEGGVCVQDHRETSTRLQDHSTSEHQAAPRRSRLNVTKFCEKKEWIYADSVAPDQPAHLLCQAVMDLCCFLLISILGMRGEHTQK